jgi:excisionase family DNA binding protein
MLTATRSPSSRQLDRGQGLHGAQRSAPTQADEEDELSQSHKEATREAIVPINKVHRGRERREGRLSSALDKLLMHRATQLHLRCGSAATPAATRYRRDTTGVQAKQGASRPAGSRPASSSVFSDRAPGPQGTAPTRRRFGCAALDRPGLVWTRNLKKRRCGRWCGRWCGRPQLIVTSMTTPYPTLQPAEERLVYTVAEAGELLGISRAFAYELVARGDLPVICLGRRRLVPKAALLALVGQVSTDQSKNPLGSRHF